MHFVSRKYNLDNKHISSPVNFYQSTEKLHKIVSNRTDSRINSKHKRESKKYILDRYDQIR